MGRHAPTLLADDPTFPWNTTASAMASRQGSRHGSSVARSHVLGSFPPSIRGFPTSAAGPPSITGPQVGSLDRRASRLASASPLVGRGSHRFSSLELPCGDDDLGAVPPFSNDQYQPFTDGDPDSFELHGPAAGVGTQTQAQTQWIEATLDREAHNFLDFLKEEIAALPVPQMQALSGEEDELASSLPPKQEPIVEFEQLLPPREHSKIVAAQALHHALALATKNLLNVEQEVPFGPIKLGVAMGA